MLRFPVSAAKAEDLHRRMAALGLAERELVERFYCPQQGKGKKRSAQVGVHLRHEAMRLEVRSDRSASQPLNRFLARRMLVRMLEKRLGKDDAGKGEAAKKGRAAALGNAGETMEQHMHRMFVSNFEKDIAQPYPIASQKLLGAGELPRNLIGILGDGGTKPSPRARADGRRSAK